MRGAPHPTSPSFEPSVSRILEAHGASVVQVWPRAKFARRVNGVAHVETRTRAVQRPRRSGPLAWSLPPPPPLASLHFCSVDDDLACRRDRNRFPHGGDQMLNRTEKGRALSPFGGRIWDPCPPPLPSLPLASPRRRRNALVAPFAPPPPPSALSPVLSLAPSASPRSRLDRRVPLRSPCLRRPSWSRSSPDRPPDASSFDDDAKSPAAADCERWYAPQPREFHRGLCLTSTRPIPSPRGAQEEKCDRQGGKRGTPHWRTLSAPFLVLSFALS